MKEFSSEHVLLTGGTGFFGRALLRNWLNQYEAGEKIARICVLSRRPNAFLKKNPEFRDQDWLKFHKGDILKPDTFPKNQIFSHILHAAADSTLGPKIKPLERYIQIVEGTRNMLDYAVKEKIVRFLLTSSGGVYGPQPSEMLALTENYNGMPDPLISDNAYSVAKRCAEHLCTLYRENFGLQTVVARCFSFVGQDLPKDAHFAIGNFIRDALSGNEIIISGDGSPIRTYLDQRDLANWLNTILFKGRDGEAYNIGSDIQINILDLAKLIKKLINPNIKIIVNSQKEFNNQRNKYIPNIEKIKTQFNMKINYTLEQAIVETVKKVDKIK